MPSEKADPDTETLEAEVDEEDLVDPSDESILEEDLEEDLEDGIADDLVDDDELIADDLGVPDVVVVASPATLTDGEEASDEEEDEDEEDDEVEASLDVILKERLVVPEEEEDEDEEDEPSDTEDRADGNTRVLPKQPGEFLCQSCFLVKSDTQLADGKRMLCRDCV